MKPENPNKRRDMDRWRLARLRRIVHGSRNPNRGRQLAGSLGFRVDRITDLLIETETGRFLPRSVVDQILGTLNCPIHTLHFLAS